MMNSDTPLDYAVFQLSPRRSHCELFVSGNGKTEKLASGFLKPFVTHLKVAEEQAARSGKSIKLEVERSGNGGSWFNKGTLERFVRFVSTPEVLESANTYDAEMLQLEGARKIYSQGAGGPLSGTVGEDDTTTAETVDTTKKELVRAIDVRLVTLKQDLATACTRACSAGFSIEYVSELLIFAEYFGANHLSEACNKFISLSRRRPELLVQQQQSQSLPQHMKSFADGNIRSSSSSDMSINEPEVEHSGAGRPPDDGHKFNISQPSQLNTTELSGTTQQAKSIQQRLERAVAEEPIPSATSAFEPAQQDGGISRRLSVQDRINLFESKQKEQSTNSKNISAPGVVNRVVAGKGEHRRFPSDVSEKSLLRRWSGASDMSIDISISNSKCFNDQKESECSVGTPTSSNLQLQSRSKTEETEVASLMDIATSQCWLDLKESTAGTFSSLLPLRSHSKGFLGDRDCSEDEGTTFSITKARPASEEQGTNYMSASMSRMEYCGFGDQDASRTHQKGFSETSNNGGVKDGAVCHIQSKAEDPLKMKDQATLPDMSRTVSAVTEQVRQRDQEVLQPRTREVPSRAGGVGVKDQTNVVSKFPTFGSRVDHELKAKGPSDSQVQFEDSSGISLEGDLLEIVGPPSAHLMELLPVARPARGNQELNDELQMKANELEKLFTAHKLRTLSEQTSSSQRSRPVDVQEDHVPITLEKRHAVELPDQLPEKNPLRETSNNDVDFDASFSLKMVGNKEYGSSINQKLSTLSPDDSRGKFYYKYMQKRDVKLQEEWGTKGAQKEAKMKAMRDSLERSQVEMNSKYSRSADRQSSRYTHCHAEKLRSFSNSSALRSKIQAVESVQEVEDLEELYEQVGHVQDKSYNDPCGTNSLKLSSTKTLSSSIPQTLGASVLKSSVKSTKSVSIKHRTQTENPLAESLSNFSNFRKENAKPSAANNRVNTREKTKILSQSKSIIEETNLIKEDKPCRSESMRKSTATPGEFKDLSSVNSDSTNLTPLGFSKVQTNANFINKIQKCGDKPFLRKGNGRGPGLGANVPKPKTSMVYGLIKNGKDFEGISRQDDSPGLVRDILEVVSSGKGDVEAANFPVDSDSEKPKHSQEYENSDDFGLANVQRSLSQVDCDAVPVSPKFGTAARNAQEFPRESPRQWNQHLHNSISYVHEASDIDASLDSPVGSPAPWNLNLLPLDQMEADAARMRKKWGTARMPMIVANASQRSRKDVTKGFKRILKFGRKTRGLDSLVPDWVSAITASEGDDDTEDGRDLAAWPVDELRKSRMGYSFPHDSFNGEIFPEQEHLLRSLIPNPPANFKLREDHLTGSSLKAPRSFFSLSSFQGKESKPR